MPATVGTWGVSQHMEILLCISLPSSSYLSNKLKVFKKTFFFSITSHVLRKPDPVCPTHVTVDDMAVFIGYAF